MVVRFITSCVSNDQAFSGGREYDLPEARARQYIEEGLAVPANAELKRPVDHAETATMKRKPEKR